MQTHQSNHTEIIKIVVATPNTLYFQLYCKHEDECVDLQLLKRECGVSERSMQWTHPASLNCSDDKQFIGTGVCR